MYFVLCMCIKFVIRKQTNSYIMRASMTMLNILYAWITLIYICICVIYVYIYKCILCYACVLNL